MDFVFFETELAKLIYFSTEHLLYIALKSNVEYSLKNVEATFKKIHEIKKEEQIFVVIDISKISFEHIPKETLTFMADNPYVKYQLKLAVVVKNLAHQILGSSYLKLFEPKTETRVFKTLPDAIKWFDIKDRDTKLMEIEKTLQYYS